MFTVFYRKSQYNPYRSYYQNANRYAGSKSFKTLAEAKAFAATVNTKYIINPMGKKISEEV
jgi:hypothetical protein